MFLELIACETSSNRLLKITRIGLNGKAGVRASVSYGLLQTRCVSVSVSRMKRALMLPSSSTICTLLSDLYLKDTRILV